MHEFDILLINTYLLAVFSMVVRNKINAITMRTLKVLTFLMAVLFYWTLFTNLDVIDTWTLTLSRAVPLLMVIVVIIHYEFRLLMEVVGVKRGRLISNAIKDDVKNELIHGIDYLSRHNIGAIITFERNDSLQEYIDHAFGIEAPLSSELIGSMFMPNTPLHDGAVIVKDNIIKCAGAYFPPSESEKIPKNMGSRHRAAIGISERNDSFTVVVSEESGAISVTIDGYLDEDISRESLILYLEKYLQN